MTGLCHFQGIGGFPRDMLVNIAKDRGVYVLTTPILQFPVDLRRLIEVNYSLVI